MPEPIAELTDYAKKICIELHEYVEKYVEDNLSEYDMYEYWRTCEHQLVQYKNEKLISFL